jgi:hypothetical protein
MHYAWVKLHWVTSTKYIPYGKHRVPRVCVDEVYEFTATTVKLEEEHCYE